MQIRKRFLSLRYKVVLIIAISQMILILFFVFPMINGQHHMVEEQLKREYSTRLGAIALFVAREARQERWEQLPADLVLLAEDEFIEYLVAYDSEGKRIGGLDPDQFSELLLLSRRSEDPLTDLVFREREPSPTGFYHTKGHLYDWVQPLYAGSELTGYLNLGVSSAAVNRSVGEATNRGILVSIIALSLGAAVAFWVDRKMRSSLGQVINVTSHMADGDLSLRVEISTGDELEVLGDSFNRMADALAQRDAEVIRAQKTLEGDVLKRTAELRASQHALVQHEKMAGIGQLAAGVAHEINTPITTIITSAQFLWEDLADSRFQGDVDRIRSEALRCKYIVQNLLDFSRRSDQVIAPLNLDDAIRKAAALIRHELELQEIRMTVKSSADALPVHGCENELVQVFFNLFQNSKDSMTGGGELSVESRIGPRGEACVLISDTGSGIPMESQAKIFDPFFTTKETERGTGLGLSICYRIVENHQGRIRLNRTSPEGTVFEIDLPLRKDERDE